MPDQITTSQITRDHGPVVFSRGPDLISLRSNALHLWHAGPAEERWISQGRMRPLPIGASIDQAVAEARAWCDELTERARRNLAFAQPVRRGAGILDIEVSA